MIEALLAGGLGTMAIAGLVGYGRLQQRVESQNANFDLLRLDIKRLDDRIADLTDFLLREVRGENPHQIRRPTPITDPTRSDR